MFIGGVSLIILLCLCTVVTIGILTETSTPTPVRAPTPAATFTGTPVPVPVNTPTEKKSTPTETTTLVVGFTNEAVEATLIPKTPTVMPTPTRADVCYCSDGDIYNCSDFSGHAQAQVCYDSCMSGGRGDVHKLDRDKDGIACETLP